MKNFTKLFFSLSLLFLVAGIFSCEEEEEETTSTCIDLNVKALSEFMLEQTTVSLYAGGYRKEEDYNRLLRRTEYNYYTVDKNFSDGFVVQVAYTIGDLSGSGESKDEVKEFTVKSGDTSPAVFVVYSNEDNDTVLKELVTINSITINPDKCVGGNEQTFTEDDIEKAVTKNDSIPTPVVGTIENISSTSFTITGNGIDKGDKDPSEYGILYGDGQSYKYITSKDSISNFDIEVSDLKPGTKYLVWAYAKLNEDGKEYYSRGFREVTTLTEDKKEIVKPTVLVGAEIKSTTSSSFTIAGNKVENGSPEPTEFGVAYALSDDSTKVVEKIASDGSASGFEVEVPGLDANTEYFVWAYAVQEGETIYSASSTSVTTSIEEPTVTVGTTVSNVTPGSFTIAGNTVDGGSPAPTEFGVAYAMTDDSANSQKIPSNGSATGYKVSISELDANTEYFVWAYAVQEGETIYSASSTSVTTASEEPTVTVGTTVSEVTSGSFTISGNIVDGGSPAPTEFGIAYATTDDSANSQKISSNGSASSYEVSVTGLDPETTYYVWAYAVQDGNTIYSSSSKQIVTETEVATQGTVTFNGQEYTIDGGSWNEFISGEILLDMYQQGDGFQDFGIGITLISNDPEGIVSGTYTFNGSGLKFDDSSQVSTTNSSLVSTYYDATGGTIILTIEANGDYTLEMDFTTTGGAVTGTYTIPKVY